MLALLKRPAPLLALVALACFGGVGLALLSQYRFDMQPCPWCTLQRLIFLVLGTIFMGLATPTEAGAMGAVGADDLETLSRRILDQVNKAVDQMLTAALASRQSVAGELERAKQEALEGVNLGIATGIEMTEARALVAEAEVRRKDAALEPFAAVADEYHDSDDDHHEVWMDAGPQRLIRSTFELRKFRAARAALQPATIADQGEG